MTRSFDLIVSGGAVIDGTGTRPAFRADIGVTGGRVVAVEDLSDAVAGRVVDATGSMVSPGFIDVHVHSEGSFLLGDDDRFGSSLQGVTTHLTAADGFGWAGTRPEHAHALWRLSESIYGRPDGFTVHWPSIIDYREAFRGRLPVNLALQVPHHAVRAQVMGLEQRVATDAELAEMVRAAEAWMDAGAVGLAVGLDYIPGGFSDERELAALAGVAARHDGSIQSHARFTELGLAGAWEEMLRIGARTGVRVNVSHSTFDEPLVELISRSGRDVDLAIDTYLYPAGCTHLLYLIPTVHQQELDVFLSGLSDPRRRAQALMHLERAYGRSEPSRMTIGATRTGTYDGLTIADLSARWSTTPHEASLRLVQEEDGDVLIVYGQSVSDEEFGERIRMTLDFDNAMIASDGIYRGTRTHPRGFGCFVQVLGRFARDERVLGLEEAVHRMTGLPAQRYRLHDRGRVAVGLPADLVVFDAGTVADRSTWLEPRLGPVGVSDVLVNGVAVVAGGTLTGAQPGVVLG
jgi:N-acyl-D-amino-acid deacylase